MEAKLIARVIVLLDGSVHIAFYDKTTVVCTYERLGTLLGSPCETLEQRTQWKSNTDKVNPDGNELPKIQGLTLLKCFSDNQVVCVFPELLRYMYRSHSENEKPQQSIWLKDIQFDNSYEVTDEKQFYLRFLLNSRKLFSKTRVKLKLDVSPSARREILEEIITTFVNATFKESADAYSVRADAISQPDVETTPSERPPVAEPSASTTSIAVEGADKAQPTETVDGIQKEDDVPLMVDMSHMLSVHEFALKENVKTSTVYNWLSKNNIIGEVIRKGSKDYLISPDAKPASRRHFKEVNLPPQQSPLRGMSYVELQKRIKEDGLVSSVAAPYIRTEDEYAFFTSNDYSEAIFTVCGEERHVFILDINPDYYVEELSLTNRELISSEKAPIVPGSDKTPEGCREYVVHHLGQEDCVLCIMDSKVHSEQSSIFHHSRSSKPGLRENADKQKISFWNEYIRQYDILHTYASIPKKSLNRTSKYYKKNNQK